MSIFVPQFPIQLTSYFQYIQNLAVKKWLPFELICAIDLECIVTSNFVSPYPILLTSVQQKHSRQKVASVWAYMCSETIGHTVHLYGTNQKKWGRSWIHVIVLKYLELWCSQNGFSVEVTLLYMVTNVCGSPKTLFILAGCPGRNIQGRGYSRKN